MPKIQPFTIVAGDSEPIPMQMLGYDNVTAIDLTGVNDIRALFKQRQADPDDKARIIKVLSRGVTITNAAQGLITVAIDPADTANITTLTPLSYSVAAFWFGGDRITGCMGTLTVISGSVLATS